MQYLLDTNAIIRHFAKTSKLGSRAKKIITEAENNRHQLFVSIISLMEIMYLAEGKKISITLEEMIDHLKLKQCYSIIEFNLDILRQADKIKFYELHDRLILATAKLLSIPIISSDQKFSTVPGIEVIW